MLPRLLRRFTGSLLTQISQSAICRRFHSVQSRFARWQLMTSDRMKSPDFQITQDFLSHMLGVRREAINKASAIFQEQQLIINIRGNISINDLPGLEKAACRCYDFIKAEERSYPVKPFKNPQPV